MRWEARQLHRQHPSTYPRLISHRDLPILLKKKRGRPRARVPWGFVSILGRAVKTVGPAAVRRPGGGAGGGGGGVYLDLTSWFLRCITCNGFLFVVMRDSVLVWFFVNCFFYSWIVVCAMRRCAALCFALLRDAEVLRAAVAYSRLRYYAICTGMKIGHWVDIEIARASVGVS